KSDGGVLCEAFLRLPFLEVAPVGRVSPRSLVSSNPKNSGTILCPLAKRRSDPLLSKKVCRQRFRISLASTGWVYVPVVGVVPIFAFEVGVPDHLLDPGGVEQVINRSPNLAEPRDGEELQLVAGNVVPEVLAINISF